MHISQRSAQDKSADEMLHIAQAINTHLSATIDTIIYISYGTFAARMHLQRKLYMCTTRCMKMTCPVESEIITSEENGV